MARSSSPRALLTSLVLTGLVALTGCSGLDIGDGATATTTTIAPVVLTAFHHRARVTPRSTSR